MLTWCIQPTFFFWYCLINKQSINQSKKCVVFVFNILTVQTFMAEIQNLEPSCTDSENISIHNLFCSSYSLWKAALYWCYSNITLRVCSEPNRMCFVDYLSLWCAILLYCTHIFKEIFNKSLKASQTAMFYLCDHDLHMHAYWIVIGIVFLAYIELFIAIFTLYSNSTVDSRVQLTDDVKRCGVSFTQS